MPVNFLLPHKTRGAQADRRTADAIRVTADGCGQTNGQKKTRLCTGNKPVPACAGRLQPPPVPSRRAPPAHGLRCATACPQGGGRPTVLWPVQESGVTDSLTAPCVMPDRRRPLRQTGRRSSRLRIRMCRLRRRRHRTCCTCTGILLCRRRQAGIACPDGLPAS